MKNSFEWFKIRFGQAEARLCKLEDGTIGNYQTWGTERKKIEKENKQTLWDL